MAPSDSSSSLDYAEYYDRQAEATAWHGPAVLLGLMYPHIQAGQSLLDLGIGTGLGSVPFHRAGLRIFGMDNSSVMLEAVRAKGFTEGLLDHDLTSTPYPYGRDSFDHVICMGVLQFFSDLGLVFEEVGRILRSDGVFGFTVVDHKPGEPATFKSSREHTKSEREVVMYRHDESVVRGSLATGGLGLQADLEFVVFMDAERTAPMAMRAYVAKVA